MLTDCSNPRLLARLAPASISCAHPETPRWRNQPQGNCGYCLPCLVRRAALAQIGQDRSDDYAWDALADPELLDTSSARAPTCGRPCTASTHTGTNSILSGTRPCRPANTTPISSYGGEALKRSGPGSLPVPAPSPS